jgi:hypothetical protein
MYSANVQEVHVPEIVDTFEGTSTPVSNATVLKSQREWLPSFEGSRYLKSQNVFDILGGSIKSLGETPNNWNSYGSPAPSRAAVKNALPILKTLRAKLLRPERVLPSAEGGVSFIFVSDTISRAVIETLNDSASYALLYDLNGNSKTIDWPNSEQAQLDLVDQLAAHLRSNGIAAEAE